MKRKPMLVMISLVTLLAAMAQGQPPLTGWKTTVYLPGPRRPLQSPPPAADKGDQMFKSILPMHCLVVVLSLNAPPSWNGSVATLGMDGAWTVPDWNQLRRFADGGIDAPGRCFALELLRQRANLHFTKVPDDRCDDPTGGRRDMVAVAAADPVVQSCRTPVVCQTGETCA